MSTRLCVCVWGRQSIFSFPPQGRFVIKLLGWGFSARLELQKLWRERETEKEREGERASEQNHNDTAPSGVWNSPPNPYANSISPRPRRPQQGPPEPFNPNLWKSVIHSFATIAGLLIALTPLINAQIGFWAPWSEMRVSLRRSTETVPFLQGGSLWKRNVSNPQWGSGMKEMCGSYLRGFCWWEVSP